MMQESDLTSPPFYLYYVFHSMRSNSNFQQELTGKPSLRRQYFEERKAEPRKTEERKTEERKTEKRKTEERKTKPRKTEPREIQAVPSR